jgi:ribonuclease Z
VPSGGRAMLEAIPGGGPEEVPFPLRIREVGDDLTHAVVYETDEFTVEARPLDHRGFAMGFRLEERARPGRFQPERARALGVPEGLAFGRLQDGTPVTVADGTTVQPEQVLGPSRPGISFAYVTDTRPCEGGRTLAENADLLYHDATCADDHRDRAETTGHATARQAATVARDASATRLLLGHLSARYPDPAPLAREAQSVFSEAAVAEELRRYELDPRAKEPGPSSA